MASNILKHRTIRKGLRLSKQALDWWLGELREIFDLAMGLGKPRQIWFRIASGNEPVPIDAGQKKYSGAKRNIGLHLADNIILYRKIKLPVAARKNLRRVVGYEFNRYFPFDVDNACYSCRSTDPDPSGPSMEVEIYAVGKMRLDACLEKIREQYGLAACKLSIADSRGRVLISHDVDQERRLHKAGESDRLSRVLNLVIAGLVIAIVIYPLTRFDAYLEQQRQQISILEKRSRPIIELREQTTKLNQRFDELVEVRKQAPDPVSIWSYVTANLSAGITLDRLEIDGSRVRLAGRASSVEALLKNLESKPRIAGVQINAPVEPDPDGLGETMNLTLTLKD